VQTRHRGTCKLTDKKRNQDAYWRENLKIVAALLLVWAFVSFGLGIVLRPLISHIKIGGADLGFWFAQQGSIYVFVVLIFVYAVLMNRLDKRYGVDEGE